MDDSGSRRRLPRRRYSVPSSSNMESMTACASARCAIAASRMSSTGRSSAAAPQTPFPNVARSRGSKPGGSSRNPAFPHPGRRTYPGGCQGPLCRVASRRSRAAGLGARSSAGGRLVRRNRRQPADPAGERNVRRPYRRRSRRPAAAARGCSRAGLGAVALGARCDARLHLRARPRGTKLVRTGERRFQCPDAKNCQAR